MDLTPDEKRAVVTVVEHTLESFGHLDYDYFEPADFNEKSFGKARYLIESVLSKLLTEAED